MMIKKLAAVLSAAAFAATIAALPAAADAAPAGPEADENGVYGTAGIVWMIQDQWDHKKDIDADPTDEYEEAVISGTYHNVNITGNGQYTVDMSGYHAPQEWLDIGVQAGYLGVQVKMDFDTYEDVISFEIDEATIDGVTYTFEHGINEETGDPYQPLEDPEGSDFEVEGQKMIKIKNGYGNHVPSTPEMDDKAWTTTDTITMTFTVTGLPTDKIEGYEDEIIEQVYGSGSIDNDAGEEEEAETEEDTSDGGEDAAEEDTDGAAKEDKAEDKKDDSKEEETEEKSNTGLIVGICAGVAVVIAVVVCVIVKKKK